MNTNNLHRFGVIGQARIACNTRGCRGFGALVLGQGPAEDFSLDELNVAAFRHITRWSDVTERTIEPAPPVLVPAGGENRGGGFGMFLAVLVGGALALLGGILMEVFK